MYRSRPPVGQAVEGAIPVEPALAGPYLTWRYFAPVSTKPTEDFRSIYLVEKRRNLQFAIIAQKRISQGLLN